MDLSSLPDWVLWYALGSPLVVALVALVGVFFTNWRTTVNIEKAAAAARESKRLERHQDRISDAYVRIEVARRALEDILSDTVYDQRPGAFRNEVPDNHEEIRSRFAVLREAHAFGSLYVTNDVSGRLGRLTLTVNQAARAVELLKQRDDDGSVQAVLDKVMDALEGLSDIRTQMRIELGTADPDELR
ncbi:hypothetical protein AB1046_09050 [Promicromonospora sp. Populi]|uniref:hypothetical protein n=1 Tax=Promicromonospora sp. Populi TaxID=3239420 RepID=UPI0034E22937